MTVLVGETRCAKFVSMKVAVCRLWREDKESFEMSAIPAVKLFALYGYGTYIITIDSSYVYFLLLFFLLFL
jgi:hypothetical protein